MFKVPLWNISDRIKTEQCKSIDWVLSYLSVHRKRPLNDPEYKNEILYKTHKKDLRVYALS